ncbi:unnamed protein product [Clonostachys rosea f. rosea IK726]|uniref:Uncharacterized protein n=1 Tax=Clonostachys rosea f. rosea IK726 TaxID=1349383 RepID=A0ACA9UQH7_BIOOC|nr:unnamed protein product [Clonostachys rosea f. rosea IK726]
MKNDEDNLDEDNLDEEDLDGEELDEDTIQVDSHKTVIEISDGQDADSDLGEDEDDNESGQDIAQTTKKKSAKPEYYMTDFAKVDGCWKQVQGVKADIADVRFDFIPGPSACIRAIAFDYDMRFKEISKEIGKSKSGYTSEVPFIRHTRAAVERAAKAEISRFCNPAAGIAKERVEVLMLLKVDILTLRFLAPRSFNTQIAVMLVSMGRTDLMVCGRMEPRGRIQPQSAKENVDLAAAMEKIANRDAEVNQLRESIEALCARTDQVVDKVITTNEKVASIDKRMDALNGAAVERMNRMEAWQRVHGSSIDELRVANRSKDSAPLPEAATRASIFGKNIHPSGNAASTPMSTRQGRSFAEDMERVVHQDTPSKVSNAAASVKKSTKASRADSPIAESVASTSKRITPARNTVENLVTPSKSAN